MIAFLLLVAVQPPDCSPCEGVVARVIDGRSIVVWTTERSGAGRMIPIRIEGIPPPASAVADAAAAAALQTIVAGRTLRYTANGQRTFLLRHADVLVDVPVRGFVSLSAELALVLGASP